MTDDVTDPKTLARLDIAQADARVELESRARSDKFDLDESSMTWLWARGYMSHATYWHGLGLIQAQRAVQIAADMAARKPVDLQHVECLGAVN